MKRTKATDKQIKRLNFSLELILHLITQKFTPDNKGCYSVETANFRFFGTTNNYIAVYYSNSNDKCMQYPDGIIHKNNEFINANQCINENIDYEEILSECFSELSDLIKV